MVRLRPRHEIRHRLFLATAFGPEQGHCSVVEPGHLRKLQQVELRPDCVGPRPDRMTGRAANPIVAAQKAIGASRVKRGRRCSPSIKPYPVGHRLRKGIVLQSTTKNLNSRSVPPHRDHRGDVHPFSHGEPGEPHSQRLFRQAFCLRDDACGQRSLRPSILSTRSRIGTAERSRKLASELVDDALNTGAQGADTGHDGIAVGAARADRHLGAVSGLAHQHRDRDALVGDLRDLALEQAAEEVGMGAAEDDPGPLAELGHGPDDSTDRLAGAERLPRDLLRPGQKGFGRTAGRRERDGIPRNPLSTRRVVIGETSWNDDKQSNVPLTTPVSAPGARITGTIGRLGLGPEIIGILAGVIRDKIRVVPG